MSSACHLMVGSVVGVLAFFAVLANALAIVGLDMNDEVSTWTAPRPGLQPFVGHQAHFFDLIWKRDCLSNGSNYCFGNSVNFCSDCGTCCVDGLYCCGRGGTCCGGGCCVTGLTCSDDGQCLASSVNAILTSTLYETITVLATQNATVIVVEIDTSTVLSTTEITVSNAETQTNVEWATATVTTGAKTVLAKRAADYGRPSQARNLKALWNGFVLRGLGGSSHEPEIHPRQQTTKKYSGEISASTMVKHTTEFKRVTDISYNTISITTTSYVMTTIYETVTRVLNAKETTVITSTLTITSHQPATQTITTTALAPNPLQPVVTTFATPTTLITSSSSSPSTATPVTSTQAFSISAIAGISVGAGLGVILLLGGIAICIRYRRRHRVDNESITTSAADGGLPDNAQHYHDDRQPTLPRLLPQFTPSAPLHHDAPTELPKGYRDSHQRSSSGFSTLVDTSSVGGPGAKGADRRSTMSMGSTVGNTALTGAPAEVQGCPVSERHEVEGSTSTNRTSNSGSPRPRAPRPHLHRHGISFYHPTPTEEHAVEELDAT
ncbi:hypothetical protein B0H66DRAFT_9750 [Apodospora peruviana]|uniref:Mid2 domain-containing protein n=1 Tax=Apodospora peruviana TaxID=516989 RepID=A0AAE0IQB6_9PEZI|nr:hypothetical protein B0H66DRAFT_9750 [Apodospora peruviana]